jgi:hypothetical protein
LAEVLVEDVLAICHHILDDEHLIVFQSDVESRDLGSGFERACDVQNFCGVICQELDHRLNLEE